MQRVKIFKSHINEVSDTNNIESSLNSFVKDKNIISITQSMVAKPGTPEKGSLYFITITVVYDDKK